MRTPVCEQLGIEFPIFAFSHCRDVVIAVSKAGGLGVFGAVTFTPEELDTELALVEAALDGRPYGVDVLVPAHYVGEETGGQSFEELSAQIPEAHRAFVVDLLDRYEVPELPAGVSASMTNALAHSERAGLGYLDVTFAHHPVLVVNALGPAPAAMVEQAHQRGMVVGGLVGSPQHAQRQLDAGVDLIVAQGAEAGGHTGEVGTMVLVPQVVDVAGDTPVLAAGGIADGRQVASALALGAQGVWCGSVWLTTEEAETNPAVRDKFLAATSRDTVRSRSRTGKPARQLRSAWTDEWDEPDHPEPLPMPLQGLLTAEAMQRIDRSAGSSPGAGRLANYFIGQVVGQMNRVTTCRQVVLDMVEQYVDTMERLSKLDKM